MQRVMMAIVGLGLFALLGVACTGGDTQVSVATSQQVGIAVSGTGTVSVEPDVGVISLGVEVRGESVADARDRAAEAMDAVLDAVRDNGVDAADVKTLFFNIYPNYSFVQDREPEITGYTVSNQVEVKVRDLDRFSDVLDGAIAAAGDDVRVNSIGFTVDDPAEAQGDARVEALADARARAEQIAAETGVTLGRVISVSESTDGMVGPPFESAMDGRGGGPTPVSPGEQEVRVNVSVVYEIE